MLANFYSKQEEEKTNLQINPTSLDINPNIEKGTNPVELVVPRCSLFFEDLEEWRHFHSRNTVEMLGNY